LHREIAQAYVKVVDVEAVELVELARNPSLLKIIAPMMQFIDSLPPYTRFTRRISLPAQKLRGAILNAREPLKLLHEDIPEALGLESAVRCVEIDKAWSDQLRKNLQNALVELHDAFDILYHEVRGYIQQAFSGQQTARDIDALRREAQIGLLPLLDYCGDNDLKPVLGAFLRNSEDSREWVLGIAGQIAKKPMDSWRDSDIEPFRASLLEAIDRIDTLSAIVATGVGSGNGENIVISITHGDGRTLRKVLKTDGREGLGVLAKGYKELLELPKEEREALCALLADSLEEGS
jgi:hypothetical protein